MALDAGLETDDGWVEGMGLGAFDDDDDDDDDDADNNTDDDDGGDAEDDVEFGLGLASLVLVGRGWADDGGWLVGMELEAFVEDRI